MLSRVNNAAFSGRAGNPRNLRSSHARKSATGRDSTLELIQRTHTTGHFRSCGVTAQFSSNRTSDSDKRNDAGG
jgi:hypothetical protein